MWRQNFNGNRPVQRLIKAFKHDAHRSGTNDARDFHTSKSSQLRGVIGRPQCIQNILNDEWRVVGRCVFKASTLQHLRRFMPRIRIGRLPFKETPAIVATVQVHSDGLLFAVVKIAAKKVFQLPTIANCCYGIHSCASAS